MMTLSRENFRLTGDGGRLLGCRDKSMGHGVVDLRECGLCNFQDEQLKACSRCKAAWYCSPDHQRQHWRQHKLSCKPQNGAVRGHVGHNGMGENTQKSALKRPDKDTNFTFDTTLLDAMAGSESGGATSDYELKFQGSQVSDGYGRRRSYNEDFSTPIDSSNPLEASSQLHQVEVCPDSQSLEERGFSPKWFEYVMKLVIEDLNKYGLCVVDDFLSK